MAISSQLIGRLGGGVEHIVIPSSNYTGTNTVHPVTTINVPSGVQMLMAASIRGLPLTSNAMNRNGPRWLINGVEKDYINGGAGSIVVVLGPGQNTISIKTDSTLGTYVITSEIDVYTSPL